MAPRTPKVDPEAEFLICNVSFVGYYDGDSFRQFVAQKGKTIIEIASREAKLWGEAHDQDGQPLFRVLTPSFLTAKQLADPYREVEHATAVAGERRGD